MMMAMSEFSDKIRWWFRRTGMTQAELAEKLQVERNSVSQQLSGRIRFRPDRLPKLLAALNIPDEERRRLKRLYLADIAPAPLRDELAAMAASAEGIEQGSTLAPAVLDAERAFDEVGKVGATGARQAFLKLVVELEVAMGVLDARSGKRHADRIKSIDDRALARLAGQLALRLFRPAKGGRAKEASAKLSRLLTKDSVEHYIEFAKGTAAGLKRSKES